MSNRIAFIYSILWDIGAFSTVRGRFWKTNPMGLSIVGVVRQG